MDQAQGEGVLVSKHFGYTFTGTYESGARVQGVVKWSNGDSWVGRFFRDHSSRGVFTLASGEAFEAKCFDYSMRNRRRIVANKKEGRGDTDDNNGHDIDDNNNNDKETEEEREGRHHHYFLRESKAL